MTDLYETIDFNEASAEWRKNKIKQEKGYFKYKCCVHGCENELYSYTTEHAHFHLFATDFDIQNKMNPTKHTYCEEHLIHTKKGMLDTPILR